MYFSQQNLSQSLKQLGVTNEGDIFNQLAMQYADSNRYYHDDQHIIECLTHLEQFHSVTHQLAEIEAEIWFHDAVYDTSQSDNEERSAQWAHEYLSSQAVPAMVVERIKKMILSTKTHVPFNHDSKILLDIDLGILGASEMAFDAYDQAIRNEYAWVDDGVYEAGRRHVLQSFLNRERIYHTELMFEQYEYSARQNIMRRLAREL